MSTSNYLSEVINSETIQSWEGKNVLIESGTNTGKSHFILYKLREYAKANNKKMLLLVPRISIKKQFKEKIEKFDDGVIELQSYQYVENICKENTEDANKRIDNILAKYDFIIMDEAQYFETDASINPQTELSLNAILRNKHTHIFVTATAKRIRHYLEDIIKIKLENVFFNPGNNRNISTLYFYNDDDDLYSMIDMAVAYKTKCIVFVNKIEEGVALFKRYQNYSLFYCSEGKDEYEMYTDKEEVQFMIENEKFRKLILIATSVLDAGFNIRDSDLHHIFIHGISDMNTIEQFIGRKRSNPDVISDTISVYIKAISNQSISGRKRTLANNLVPVDYFREHGSTNYLKRYPRKHDFYEIIYGKPVEGDESGKCYLLINEIRDYHYRCDLEELTEMLTYKDKENTARKVKKDNASAFKFYVIERLNVDPSHCEDIRKMEVICNLEEYLNNLAFREDKGVMLSPANREDFLDTIRTITSREKIKTAKVLNDLFIHEYHIPYYIRTFETSRIENDKKKNYRCAWEIEYDPNIIADYC